MPPGNLHLLSLIVKTTLKDRHYQPPKGKKQDQGKVDHSSELTEVVSDTA